MQWNGGTPPPTDGRHNPLRTVLETLQQRAEPYITRYGDSQGVGYGPMLNSIFRGGTEMAPGAGDLVALEDLQTATREGDVVGMGLGILGAIPGLPAIGKGVRRGARRARSAATAADAARQVDSPSYRVQSSQDLAPTDTPESLRAQGYEIDPATNTWARVVGREPQSVADLVSGAEAMGARLDLSQGRNGLTLSRIEVPPSARSQGVGSEIMRQVEGYADRNALPVGLTPSGDFGGSVPRLNEFYKRFGFAPNSGRSRDFSTRETMLRQPRAIEPVEPDYPIRAYHGSPHSFDQFSLDAIGTGEGAQAYGHGLYFAESEDVARSYRDDLTFQHGISEAAPTFDGVPVSVGGSRYNTNADSGDQLVDELGIRGDSGAITLAYDILRGLKGGKPLEDELASARAGLWGWDEPTMATRNRVIDWFEQNPQRIGVRPANPGSMYEVGINAHPDTFLDWDRPLSQQSEQVQRAYSQFAETMPNAARDYIRSDDPTGQDFLRAYSEGFEHDPADWRNALDGFGSNRKQFSEHLSAQGVPGIRYLDGNSRGTGEGSSNYVVFNDALIKVLRKYGISTLGLGLGTAGLADQVDEPQPTGL